MSDIFSIRLYKRLCGLGRFLSGALYRPVIEGLENVPESGPVILCSNHVSLRDPVVLASFVDRPVFFMAKKELFQSKWFGGFLRRIGAFPVARGEADLGAVRASIGLLKDSGCLGIYAQGTRRKKSATEEPPMNTGVAMIAARSGAPVVPVYVKGPYRLFRRMRLSFGKPLDFTSIAKPDSTALQNMTNEIHDAIYALDVPQDHT